MNFIMNSFMIILWGILVIGLVMLLIKSRKLDKVRAFDDEIEKKHIESIRHLLDIMIPNGYESSNIKYIIEEDGHIAIWKIFTDDGDYYYETKYYIEDGNLTYTYFEENDES